MSLTIIRNPEPPRIIRMGQAPKPIEPELVKVAPSTPEQPPVTEPENKKGRKKMADEKKLGHETGVKKISEDDAGTQGAVGSGGQNAPAQEKAPEKSPASDKEGK